MNEFINWAIGIVTRDILERFPGCSYTINVLLWNDNTSRVECRHGNEEGTKVYCSVYYNNELTFNEIDINDKIMIKDKFGNNNYYYLSKYKQI